MKLILALAGSLTLMIPPLAAEDSTNVPAAITTNAPAAAEPEAASTELDLKELLKLPQFTNDTGMVMVKISDAQWVGAYEVTQEEYQKIAGSNPSSFQGARNPVESVSWNDAMSFCTKLTEAEAGKKMLPEGMTYTLPTQAQWESLAAGADLKNAVTGSGTRRSSTAAVGSLGATGTGLYDIRGNVCEWCLDPQDKPFRVARGAAWDTFVEVNLRPEFRWYFAPGDRKNNVGFRCVLGKP